MTTTKLPQPQQQQQKVPTETNLFLTVNLCFFISLNPVSWHIPFTCPSWCGNQRFWLYSCLISCSKLQEQKNTHSTLINFIVHLSWHPSPNRGRIFSTHSIENDLNSEMKWNKVGYTATPVACGWAEAIFEFTWSFGQEQWGQRPQKPKKSKVWRTDGRTDGPTVRRTDRQNGV